MSPPPPPGKIPFASGPSVTPRSVLPWPVLLLVVLNMLPEVVFVLSDRGLAGLPFFLRQLAYAAGAFRPDLLTGSGPFFPGHSVSMFLTYGILHTGPGHLIANMLGLVWLGRLILSYRTSETFLTLYIMATIGAAEAFALFGDGADSVVGASGALFGLFGVYAMDQGMFTTRAGSAARQVLARLVLATGLVVLSDILGQTLLGSQVAWQAHAGGFLTGALFAWLSPPRYRSGQTAP